MGTWLDWKRMEELVLSEGFDHGDEEKDLFTSLKKATTKASVEDLDSEAAHAPLAWEFIVGFAGKKKTYRRQVLQVVNKLTESAKWVAAWEAHTALHAKVQSLHEELQAALATQHEAIQKSIAPGALKSMHLVPKEDRRENVRQAVQKQKLVDEINASHPASEGLDAIGATATSAEEELEVSAPGASAELAALQEGIDAAISLDDDAKMDSGGTQALVKLRIGCIQCAGDVAAFDKEVDNAQQVFSFLLHYAGRHPAAAPEVAEVMNQLMVVPSWAATFEVSTQLREKLQELPEETQAALGLQHPKLLRLISPEAQRKAEAGTVSEAVKSVAVKMQSVRFPAAASDETAAPPPPPRPPTAKHWKEARTPQGHTYYFNVITRESTWERPAELGGPVTYNVGDKVEVWSNSQKAWFPGEVVKVDGGKVTADFVMKDGSPGKKELPTNHRDLRLVTSTSKTEAFSSEEQALYRKLFDELPGSARAKNPKDVSDFLLKSGARRRTLKQVWWVALTPGKGEVEFDDFARCCRLIAHCQVLGLDSEMVAAGERPLRVALRGACLFTVPPKLPVFRV